MLTKSRATASTQGRVSRITQKVRHDKYDTKCVCEICTCGIHRCPPNQRRKFQGHTTNQDFYRPYRIEADHSPAPSYQVKQRHYDPAALQTTYNVQYTPKKAPRMDTEYLDRSVEYVPRKTPFYSETEYNVKYVRQPFVHDQAEPKYEYRPNRAKFQGTTSYNAEFTPKRPERQAAVPQMTYQRQRTPFKGQTSYQAQYKRYTIAQDKPQAQYAYRPSTAKFTGESRYKEDFHPYARTNYLQDKDCPIYELPPYPPACSPGKRHLNYSAQKNYWE